MKKIIYLVSIFLVMSSCASLQNVDSQKALTATTAVISAFTITDAQVNSLCKEYMAESDKGNTILPASNAYSKRLDNIMKRFNNIGNMNINYAVYQSNTVNAFASGDGSIRVYSGLMDKMTDDEIFAVLGHELGHLKNNDVRDAYRNSYLVVAARYGIAAVNEKAGKILTNEIYGELAQQMATAAYSRQQEYDADAAAFQFCITNGVDPYAMYKALNVLVGLSNNASTKGIVSQMFATHPDSQKRAARIKSMADAATK